MAEKVKGGNDEPEGAQTSEKEEGVKAGKAKGTQGKENGHQSNRQLEDSARQGKPFGNVGVEVGPPNGAVVGRGATRQEAEADREDKITERRYEKAMEELQEGAAHVDLSNCSVGVEGAKEVAAKLRSGSGTVVLDLSGNNFGDEGLKAIAGAIGENTTLRAINLRDCNIGSGNVLGGEDNDEGIEALGDALDDNEALEQIDLCWNTVWKEGKELLAERQTQSRFILVDSGLPNPDEGRPWEFDFVGHFRKEVKE